MIRHMTQLPHIQYIWYLDSLFFSVNVNQIPLFLANSGSHQILVLL